MPARHTHVLFLNAQDGLGADVAVHVLLARSLDRTQARVSVATSMHPIPGSTSAGEAFSELPDVTLLPLELGRSLTGLRGVKLVRAGLDNAHGALNLLKLALWCRRHAVDVIHVTDRPRQTLFGLLVARLAGCACVVHAHISHHPEDNTRLASWRLHQADAVVGVSRFTAATFRDVAGLPAEKVFAVHNAVDGEVFRPQSEGAARGRMRQRLRLPMDVPVVGCIARLMRWKGQATLLEAFAEVRRVIPDVRLVLAGSPSDTAPDGQGDFQDYLVRRITALGLEGSVTLPGFIAKHEMPDFYAALDAVAHPAFEEPFGLAVVEAMACRKPVIASSSGGIPEIVHDGRNGLLIQPDRPTELADALLRVLGDSALAERLAQAGRERVLQAFTPQQQASAMLRVYSAVTSGRFQMSAGAVRTTDP